MPESERAKIAWPQESILSRQCFDVDCANCDNKNRDGKPCEHYCHATLTCSEVVERLAKECFLSANPNPVATIAVGSFDRAKATAILHSWRERRVQELEEALGYEIAIRDGMVREIESLVPELLVNGNAFDFTKAAVKQFAEWREQIRKGAKHE